VEYYLGSETGFVRVSRCFRRIFILLKYPVPVSRIESGWDPSSGEINFWTREILDFSAIWLNKFLQDSQILVQSSGKPSEVGKTFWIVSGYFRKVQDRQRTISESFLKLGAR